MVGMTVAGYYHENEQLAQHGLQQISVGQYLTHDNFLSALFENWESKWLQMASYVVLIDFIPLQRWSCCRSSFGSKARLNQSPLMQATRKPAHRAGKEAQARRGPATELLWVATSMCGFRPI
jgi:hypothetical protein